MPQVPLRENRPPMFLFSFQCLGEEPAWPLYPLKWQLFELTVPHLSQRAEGHGIWINEQAGAKHKYHRHLAIGTDNQVIHQVQNWV